MVKTVGNYVLLEPIGHGSYGTVYKAQDKTTNELVAIKEVSNSKLTSQKLIDNLEQEIKILTQIEHENIVRLFNVTKTKDKTFLVMEYCKGGDFAHFLKKKRLPEAQARFFLQQLASALQFMRDKKLIHRDLKPSNILLATTDDQPVIKVADFGYARYIEPQDLAETACGTPLYMAPEVFATRKYDSKADLWSVGCILYEMVVGRVPFIAQSQVALFQLINSQPVSFPKEVQLSTSCKDLLLKLLKRESLERITFEEFFMHPFLEFSPFSKPHLFEPLREPAGRFDPTKCLQIDDTASSKDSFDETTEPSFSSSRPNVPKPKDDDSPQANANTPATDSEDEYIMVNSAAVEVNAIADVLTRAPIIPLSSVPLPPSIFSRSMMSESPPSGISIQAGSPPLSSASSALSVGSGFSRVLATTARFMWPSTTATPEEQSARSIISSLTSLSSSASTDDERAIWNSIIISAERAYGVVDLAKAKVANRQPNEPEEDSLYAEYILYIKALSLIRIAMLQAQRFWELKDQAITNPIKQVVEFLREKFNEHTAITEELAVKLKKTKYAETMTTAKVFVDQARLVFEHAREMVRAAAKEEVIGNFRTSEGHYIAAILMYETLIAHDLPPHEVLSDNDRRIVEDHVTSTTSKLRDLQKRHPASASPSPTSPGEGGFSFF